MGYTHHWFRPPVITDDLFRAIRLDFERLLLPLADMGVPLAGWNGQNEPEINDEFIRFNGVRGCGHPKNEEIFIPYPADDARGLGPSATAIIDTWDMGVKLRHRCCGGMCCLDTFSLPKIVAEGETPIDDRPETQGLVFYWTKTAFKPYDIAVTAALLVAKRYLRNHLVIHSDGADAQWADAKDLCQHYLGYGAWFGIVEDPRIDFWPEPDGIRVEHEVRVRLLVEMDPANFGL
jgi:hypothetical protein